MRPSVVPRPGGGFGRRARPGRRCLDAPDDADSTPGIGVDGASRRATGPPTRCRAPAAAPYPGSPPPAATCCRTWDTPGAPGLRAAACGAPSPSLPAGPRPLAGRARWLPHWRGADSESARDAGAASSVCRRIRLATAPGRPAPRRPAG